MTTLDNTFNKPTRRTFFVADLKCYLCGSVAGSIESEYALTTNAGRGQSVTLRRPGQDASDQLLDWTRLRCTRCGGPLFLDESDVITRRTDEYNWLEERPRRGRPPKRLLEERRLQQLTLEADSQAA